MEPNPAKPLKYPPEGGLINPAKEWGPAPTLCVLRGSRMDMLSRVRDFAQPLARAEGVDLLEVAFAWEGREQVLRLTIERPNGPTSVADCEAVSRSVGAALDAQDLIPHHYLLEVASA